MIVNRVFTCLTLLNIVLIMSVICANAFEDGSQYHMRWQGNIL